VRGCKAVGRGCKAEGSVMRSLGSPLSPCDDDYSRTGVHVSQAKRLPLPGFHYARLGLSMRAAVARRWAAVGCSCKAVGRGCKAVGRGCVARRWAAVARRWAAVARWACVATGTHRLGGPQLRRRFLAGQLPSAVVALCWPDRRTQALMADGSSSSATAQCLRVDRGTSPPCRTPTIERAWRRRGHGNNR
jgi:hypothetical protein